MDGDRFQSSRMDALRQPPCSIEAEQAVLGGLMLDERAFARIDGWLVEEDFFRKDHRLIFRAIADQAARGKPIDSVTLGEWFEANGMAELVGGSSYVLKIANSTAGAANIAAYAEIVAEKSRLRKLIDAGTEIAGEAFSPKADASLIASKGTNTLSALLGPARAGGPRQVKGAVSTWLAHLQERYDRGQAISGLETPWSSLNSLMLGLQDGDLIVVAGRSSMGKSVLGFQLGAHVAIVRRKRSAVFSLEMREDQFVQRGVACFGKVPHEHLRNPTKMADDEWSRVSAATSLLAGAPLEVDDESGLTVAQIMARAKRMHLHAPLSLVVVDHLHEIKRPGRDPVNELGDVARALKDLAKKLRIPVVLLAQLNRGNLSRSDHRPMLSDLRASGAIEEIADVVLLLHREDYYDRNTHLKKVVEVIIGKGRDLPAGDSVYLQNCYDQMRLDDWEGPLPEKPAKATATKTTGFKKPAAKPHGEKDD